MEINYPVIAFLLDKSGSAKEIKYQELDSVNTVNKILWVHFDYSSKEAREWITNKSGIDSVAIDALLTEETRPRTTILDNALLIALRGVNLNPNSKTEDMISLFFIKSLTKKIKALESFINYNISSNSTEKIAKFLLDNESILINLKQVKIAQILNITPETFSRKLAKLKKEKVIQNEKGYIKILNHEKLRTFVNPN